MNQFPNEYTVRKVAQSSSKACYICYKPSETVLVSANKADFFYVCEGHLSDTSFAEPIKEEPYTTLVAQRDELTSSLAQKEEKTSRLKPYIWNKIKSDPDKDKKYADALEDLNKTKDDLAKVEKEIAEFKFKRYKLDPGVHKIRYQGIQRAKEEKARKQKLAADIQSADFFPSVPTGEIKR